MQYLITNAQLEGLLWSRARGEPVKSLAARYELSPPQVAGLLHKYKARLQAIYKSIGMLPPRHGGHRRNSGRRKVPDEKHSRYNMNYHPDVKQAEEKETLTLICLKCREEFESEDRCGNRLCKHCKTLHTWNTGSDFSTHHLLRRSRASLDY